MYRSIRRVAGLSALLLFFSTQLVWARGAEAPFTRPAAGAKAGAQPIQNILTPDGRLDLRSGISGSFDATGWQMLSSSTGEPQFVPDSSAAAVGDQFWDDCFVLPGVLSSEVRAVAASGLDVYVGGSFEKKWIDGSNSLLRWNGRRWYAVGGGVRSWSASGNWVYGQVNAIAISGNRVYVGGLFSRAGELVVSNIAMWDGASWSALGGGVRTGSSQDAATVHALAVIGNDVYVGGSFNTAGSVATSGVARWNQTTQSWSPLGSGLEGDIINPQGTAYALVASGSDLYVGGYFTRAGSTETRHVARWNGSNWSALGGGVSNSTSYPGVYALAADSSGVYVGGRFDRAGSVTAANIARWSGSSWSALGSGIGGAESGELPVQALALSAGQLYVGGRFTTAGGAPAISLARWNGTSWSEWGGGAEGTTPSVFAITAVNGELYIGGNFLTLGGRWASYISRWDGDEWRALGQGLHTAGGSGTVKAVAISASGEVYVGGLFDYAGETPAYNVAKWDGARW